MKQSHYEFSGFFYTVTKFSAFVLKKYHMFFRNLSTNSDIRIILANVLLALGTTLKMTKVLPKCSNFVKAKVRFLGGAKYTLAKNTQMLVLLD